MFSFKNFLSQVGNAVFKARSLKQLAKVVWETIKDITSCNINANESWCIPNKDITGKYVDNAEWSSCFGDSASNAWI